MASTLENIGLAFGRSLSPVRQKLLASWSLDSAKRLQKVLRSSVRIDGTAMPPNKPSTIRHKGRNQPGVWTRDLVNGIKRGVHIRSGTEADVFASDGVGDNDMKVNLLIHGQEREKNNKLYVQKPRPFVAHDPLVVEKNGERVLRDVLKRFGFRPGRGSQTGGAGRNP